ncbi:MAG: NIPSNAP family protein [Flammeovirgaceae bacterium]|jgi:hypothetical protein|nr:NIPSNAP family protein [Flammeovirgaceae bacterium]NQW27290.1 NIPSNAP family protein [Flammeovirgaceae bacterium]|tara:strand:+ start:143597 stop:144403 length:807 start_codon:yes stop_codon:yes gene_type:complete
MRVSPFLVLLLSIALASCNQPNNQPAEVPASINSREYYQLKVYTFQAAAQITATDTYLKDAFLPGLKRLGINNIGVFKHLTNAKDTLEQTFVLIPFNSMDQFLSLEERLSQDAAYLAVGSEYLLASYDQPPYERIESTLLKAFTEMPQMAPSMVNGPRENRIYELRSYESATERYYQTKVDMFNAGGEVKLFDRLGFNAVFYAEVVSGSKMPNLMYMTTFADMTTRDVLWKSFVDAPEWQQLLSLEKYKNSVSHADITFLIPTEYSDY